LIKASAWHIYIYQSSEVTRCSRNRVGLDYPELEQCSDNSTSAKQKLALLVNNEKKTKIQCVTAPYLLYMVSK
jgi:hypothetical protein